MFFSEFERVSFGFAPNTHRIHWTGIFTYVYFPSKSTIHGSVNIPFVPWILWDMKSPQTYQPLMAHRTHPQGLGLTPLVFSFVFGCPRTGCVKKHTVFNTIWCVCVCVWTPANVCLVCLVWFVWFVGLVGFCFFFLMFWVVERRFQPRVFQGVTVPNKTACGEVVESGKNGRISAKLKWHVNIKIPRLKTFTGNLGSKFKMYILYFHRKF